MGQGDAYKRTRPSHVTILAASQAGLKNLFKLISASLTEYFYRVSYNAGEWSEYSEVLAVTLEQLNLVGHSHLPGEYALHQNYPNPFNPSVNLDLHIPHDRRMGIGVFDILGNEIDIISDHRVYPRGTHTIHWSPKHHASGVYYIRLTDGMDSQFKKIMFIK